MAITSSIKSKLLRGAALLGSLLLSGSTTSVTDAQTLVSSDSGITILFQTNVWAAPNIHYNTGSGWTSSPGVAMSFSTDSTYVSDSGWFQYSLPSATSLEFVFNDGTGTVWDNNNNANYKVTAQGKYTVTSKVTGFSSGMRVKPNDGTGYHILFQSLGWNPVYIHYTAGSGWTTAPGVQMQPSTYGGKFSASNGWFMYTMSSSSAIEVTFNDGNGNWDSNLSANYKISSVGTYAFVNKNPPAVSVPPATPTPTTETPSPTPSGPTTAPPPGGSTPTIAPSPTPSVPSGYLSGPGYSVSSVSEVDGVLTINLSVRSGTTSTYGSDISQLVVTVYQTESDSVRVKITDKNNAARWQVPSGLYTKGKLGAAQVTAAATDKLYTFAYAMNPFSFQVTRKSDNYVIFDSSGLPLVFKDQYLQFGTKIPSGQSLYGIGESTRNNFRMNTGEKYTLWARDQGSMVSNVNLYGSHPFYLGINTAGQAHGVLLLNSNGMDVTLESGILAYQTIGGILDFSIVVGPTPAKVVSQYTTLIGRPKLMPYWAYGFHQCRWGYSSVSALNAVVNNYASNSIPLDVMWADIDYMSNYYDFTLDSNNFKEADMKAFMTTLHNKNQKFVPIVDPGIPDSSGYYPYTKGLSMNIFIKNSNGSPYLGQVWPGPTVFPDFLHPNASSYWEEQLRNQYNSFNYDGLWIDMNELANFCPGTNCVRQSGVTCPSSVGSTSCCLSCSNDGNKYDNPPFAINNVNGKDAIYNKGISTSAVHYGNVRDYDAHNLYGFTESIATDGALQKLTSKRTFVLSRSTFPGSGAYAAHWTGDNAATWNDLGWSIPTMLKFGLFGIPMVGADICGFSGSSWAELCARWTALGAFYPFARNHNNKEAASQETYVWSETITAGKKFIGMRYRLLPYYYTLGYHANAEGIPIARPLLMEFPTDTNTFSIDRQFMVGNALLVTPVLTASASSVSGYYPAGVWYNIFDYSRIESTGQTVSTTVTLYDMPVHIRGGTIVPMHQSGALTSAAARATPFDILVALPKSGSASGDLFLDDGEELAGVNHTIVTFSASAGTFTSTVTQNLYSAASSTLVNKLVILGVTSKPTTVSAGTISAYDSTTQRLEITLSSQSIATDFKVTWA